VLSFAFITGEAKLGEIILEGLQGQRAFQVKFGFWLVICFNPLNAELNPICHLLALLGAHPIFHVSGIRVDGQDSKTS
jgi:hypothetical protein